MALDAFDSEDESDGCTLRSKWRKAGIWTVASVVAIVSAKNLFEEHNYHYRKTSPQLQKRSGLIADTALRLALFINVATLIVLTVLPLVSQRATRSKTNSWKSFILSELNPAGGRNGLPWRLLLPAALLAGVSVPLFTQAILHFQNTVTLLMLTVLVHPLKDIFLAITGEPYLSHRKLANAVITALLGSLILYDEYRLLVPGLVFGLTAIIVTGLSKALLTYGALNSGATTRTSSMTSTKRLTRLAVLLSLPVITVLTYIFESKTSPPGAVNGITVLILIVNIAASTTALVIAGSLFSAPEIAGEKLGIPGFQSAQVSFCDALEFLRTGAAAILATVVSWRGYISWLQLTAYLVGIGVNSRAALEDLSSTQKILSQDRELEHEYSSRGPGLRSPTRVSGDAPDSNHQFRTASTRWKPNNAHDRTHILLYLFVALFGWISYLTQNFQSTTYTPFPPSPPHFDTTYNPHSKLDIVISMHHEPLPSIATTISKIKQLSNIAALSPRVVIYIKDENANTDHLVQALGASSVTAIPNQGRESDTYLHHIINNWDSLAEHTLFIQADIHNPREFYPRLRDYYRPHTGMLSLGFSGNVCDCQDCSDRWGWWDTSGVLSDVYRKANGRDCGAILLSYKGQFVVSARRIRGVDISVYKDLKDALVNEKGWAHQQGYLQGRPNSLNAPYFGFTMERLWSVLFQCSDLDVAWKCPTLLSGTRRGGDAGDCQCFDE